MRVKICRKEAKESAYWLDLQDIAVRPADEARRLALRDESTQLMKIFGAILRNTSRRQRRETLNFKSKSEKLTQTAPESSSR